MKFDRKTLAVVSALIFSVATSVLAAPPAHVCKKHPLIKPCLAQGHLSVNVQPPPSAPKKK